VAEFSLTAEPALGGYARRFGAVTLTEAVALTIVSVAIPVGAEAKAAKAAQAVDASFGVAPPPVGTSVQSRDGARLIRLGADLMFVLFEHPSPGAGAVVAGKLGDAAYTTDQTDVWVGLEIAGPGSRTALERICPLDLHPDAFAEADAAQTVMEHLGAVILRTGADAFLLLSMRSSAASFLHAVEVSLHHTA